MEGVIHDLENTRNAPGCTDAIFAGTIKSLESTKCILSHFKSIVILCDKLCKTQNELLAHAHAQAGELRMRMEVKCEMCEQMLSQLESEKELVQTCEEIQFEDDIEIKEEPIDMAIAETQAKAATVCESTQTEEGDNSCKDHCKNKGTQTKEYDPIALALKSDVLNGANRTCSTCRMTFHYRRSFIMHCIDTHKIRSLSSRKLQKIVEKEVLKEPKPPKVNAKMSQDLMKTIKPTIVSEYPHDQAGAGAMGPKCKVPKLKFSLRT